MADQPFPLTAKSVPELIRQTQKLFEDMYNDRIGGAILGDVFAVDSGDIFTLVLSASGGLKKDQLTLAIKNKTDGGLTSNTSGEFIKCKTLGGILTDANGIYIIVKPDNGIAIDSNGVYVKLKAAGGIEVGADGLFLSATGGSNFATISCPSGTNPVAEIVGDTLTLLAGTGITITGDETADSVTIASHARQHSITSTSDHTSTATADRILKANASGLPENSNFSQVSTGIRATTSLYRRYYHIPLGTANPGASGATWIQAGATTTGGWRLTNASHLLRGQADVHSDWDGASDLTVSVKFMVNIDNTGGADTDTVDLRLNAYYKGNGDTATKTQAVEVATVVGKSAQYKQFSASFTIDYDAVGNVVESGDVMAFVLNLETDTSEVDDIVVTSMEFYYSTTHIGIESGDT